MPTILLILGWRLFFYANESNEPMHIHCRKGEMECKFWIVEDAFDIEAAFSFGLSPRDKREIRRIVFDHFDHIAEQWHEFARTRIKQ